MMNNISDIQNNLLWAWRLMGLPAEFVPDDSLGDIVGSYHEDYDPYAESNELVCGTFIAAGIFYSTVYDEQQAGPVLVRIKEIFDETGFRSWILSPKAFAELGCNPLRTGDFAQDVVRPIRSLIQRRREARMRNMHSYSLTTLGISIAMLKGVVYICGPGWIMDSRRTCLVKNHHARSHLRLNR